MKHILPFIKHIFSYDFLFYVNPVHLSRIDTIFGLIAGIGIVVSIVCRLTMRFTQNPIAKSLWRRFFRLYATVGIVGAIWYGLRYQNIDIFGSHFTFIVLLVIVSIWKLYIVKYWFTKYAAEKQTWEKEQLKLKYINGTR